MKYEKNRSKQADPGIKVIHPEVFFHVEHSKRNKHGEGDDLLEDFQLPEIQDLMADAVGRHLKQIFKKRNSPAYERSQNPGFGVEVFQMPVPCEGHENIGKAKQHNGCQDLVHTSVAPFSILGFPDEALIFTHDFKVIEQN
jgi:hypothetical protein